MKDTAGTESMHTWPTAYLANNIDLVEDSLDKSTGKIVFPTLEQLPKGVTRKLP